MTITDNTGGTLTADPAVPLHVSKKAKSDHDDATDVQRHNDAMLLVHEIPAVITNDQNREFPDIPAVGLAPSAMVCDSSNGTNAFMASDAAATLIAASQMWQINRVGIPAAAGAAGSSSNSMCIPFGPPWPKKSIKYVNAASIPTANQPEHTLASAHIMSQMSIDDRETSSLPLPAPPRRRAAATLSSMIDAMNTMNPSTIDTLTYIHECTLSPLTRSTTHLVTLPMIHLHLFPPVPP